MSIYTVIPFLVSFLWIYLGGRTLWNDRRDPANRLFALVSLSMVIWSFFNGMVFSQKSETDLFILVEFGYLGAYFFFPLNFHLFARLCRSRIALPLLALNYLPAVVLNIAHFMGHSIYLKFDRGAEDWVAVFDFQTIWIYLYALSIIVYFCLTIAIVIRWKNRTVIRKEKICASFLLVLLSVTYLGSLILTIILPFYGVYDFQIIGAALFHTYGIGLFVLMNRYRFLNWREGIMGAEIIAGMGEAVILLDPKFRVLDVNDSFTRELLLAPDRVRGMKFAGLIREKSDLKSNLRELLEKRQSRLEILLSFHGEGKSLTTRTRIVVVRDRFGDIKGFIAIAKPLRGLEQFRKDFRITGRETEIISLIVAGMSYKEVSAKLSISVKTVEAHLANIYRKLNISNKVELIGLTRDLEIIPERHPS